MSATAEEDTMGEDTTIRVSKKLADELYQRKGRTTSYEDYLWELLEEVDESGDETEPEPEKRTTTPSPALSTDTHEESGIPNSLLEDVAEDVLPGSGAKLEARKEALRACVDFLRENGTATPSEFEEAVYPGQEAGYTSGENPSRSWWKNAMYKGLRELAERSDAIEKADTGGEWEWVGE